MPAKPTVAQRRQLALRAALEEQLAALGEPSYAGADNPASVLVAAAEAALRARTGGQRPLRGTVRAAVRGTLAELAQRAPGNSLEVRVPPYGAVQCIAGPRHTRGTPPGVVETDPLTWLALAVGKLSWGRSVEENRVAASGVRADLAAFLPLWPPSAER